MGSLSPSDGRQIFGDFLVDAADLGALLGTPPPAAGAIPFSRAEAEAARDAGCGLVYRPASDAAGRSITLAMLFEATSGDRSRGFRGDEPWFLGEPFAAQETVEPGWALFHREPLRESLNRVYDAADAALAARGDGWRRRRAVEAAFDCLALAAARGTHLLERAWDWTSTSGIDGSLANVGGFGAAGLEVLSYSRVVKHGALGMCPTLVRAEPR